MKQLSALEQIGLMAEGWVGATDDLTPTQVRLLGQSVDQLVVAWRDSGFDPSEMALPILFGMAMAMALISAAEDEASAETSPLAALFQQVQPIVPVSLGTTLIVSLACHRFIEGTLL